MKFIRKVVSSDRFVDTMENTLSFDYVEAGVILAVIDLSHKTQRGETKIGEFHCKWDERKITISKLTEEEK